jgi:hypothetical protein
LAQEGHAQLIYRFSIPLASFFLCQFFYTPKLKTLAMLVLFLVWQFYLSIYLGVFLSLFLLVLGILLPFSLPAITILSRLVSWPQKLSQAWNQGSLAERIVFLFITPGLGAFLFLLLWPYYEVSKQYGFFRPWADVDVMLPQLQSFFFADQSQIWGSLSKLLGEVPFRWEHQLFPGITILSLIAIGIAGKFYSKNSRLAWLHLGACVLLITVTLNINGYSAYWLLWKIPGVNSLRAITRIQLVLMWPLAFFSAWVINEIILRAQQKAYWLYAIVFVLMSLLIVESTLFTHVSYTKANSVSRLVYLKQRIPTTLLTPEMNQAISLKSM